MSSIVHLADVIAKRCPRDLVQKVSSMTDNPCVVVSSLSINRACFAIVLSSEWDKIGVPWHCMKLLVVPNSTRTQFVDPSFWQSHGYSKQSPTLTGFVLVANAGTVQHFWREDLLGRVATVETQP